MALIGGFRERVTAAFAVVHSDGFPLPVLAHQCILFGFRRHRCAT
jgi:hypothetical protein